MLDAMDDGVMKIDDEDADADEEVSSFVYVVLLAVESKTLISAFLC